METQAARRRQLDVVAHTARRLRGDTAAPPPGSGRKDDRGATAWDVVAATRRRRVDSEHAEMSSLHARWQSHSLVKHVKWAQHTRAHVLVARIVGRWRGHCSGVAYHQRASRRTHELDSRRIRHLELRGAMFTWRAVVTQARQHRSRLRRAAHNLLSRALARAFSGWSQQLDSGARVSRVARRIRGRQRRQVAAVSGWRAAARASQQKTEVVRWQFIGCGG
jgi:hypothetical protein